MIRNTSKVLIQYLCEFNDLSLNHISLELNISKKRFWYELSLLNEGLKDLGFSEISLNKGNILVPSDFKEYSNKLIDYLDRKELIPSTHRTFAIAVYLFIKQDWVSLPHLESLLSLSKNSVLNELKLFKDLTDNFEVELNYSRKEGYQLTGKEECIRRFCEYSISKLTTLDYGLSILQEIFAMWDLDFNREEIVGIVESCSNYFEVVFVLERFDDFINILMLVQARQKNNKIFYESETLEYIENQPLHTLGISINKKIGLDDSFENVFTTVRLLGALQGSQYLAEDLNLKKISKEIVARVKAMTMTSFTSIDTSTLEKNLYEHLVPCYFRVKFDIPTINPFTEMIKTQYLDLFILIKKCLEPFESYVEKKLTDDELSYFTIHFGGQLRSAQTHNNNFNVITVCPNGISSSLLLNSQLKSMFPSFNFMGVHTIKELETLNADSYDLIFTTVPFDTLEPCFLVKPIMSDIEKDILRRQVKTFFSIEDNSTSIDIAKIFQLIRKYAVINDDVSLYEGLYEMIYQNKIKKEGDNLNDLLTNQMIQYTDLDLDWKEGIRLAAQPLLENGFIEERYIDAMIAKVIEIGPYIVIAPKVAIPHARPEDGAKKMGISLLHSEKPINFDFNDDDEERKVHLIFVLSGVDNSSHLTALQQLASLLEEESDIDYMVQEKDVEKLYSFISKKVERMGNL